MRPVSRGRARVGLPLQIQARTGARPVAFRPVSRSFPGVRYSQGDTTLETSPAQGPVGRAPLPLRPTRRGGRVPGGITSAAPVAPPIGTDITARFDSGGSISATTTTLRVGGGASFGEATSASASLTAVDDRFVVASFNGGPFASNVTARTQDYEATWNAGPSYGPMLATFETDTRHVFFAATFDGGGSPSTVATDTQDRRFDAIFDAGQWTQINFIAQAIPTERSLSQADIEAILDSNFIDGLSLRQLLRRMAAVLMGESVNADIPGRTTYRAIQGGPSLVDGDTDGRGNRRNIDLHPSE